MNDIKALNWPLILGLGALALVRPLVNIIEDQAGVDSGPITPIAITIGISVVWIAAAGLTRVRQPLLTLVFAGLAYGVFSMVLSAIVSPILLGRLDGPLANPISIVPVLITNALWGAVTGALAMLIQRARSA
jgi:flagellar biosynthesis protein FliR